jgi:hypothetical protein
MLEGKTEFSQALKDAQEKGAIMAASKTQSSRAHSLAMTHLETAQLWARQDEEEKDRRGSIGDN